MRPWFLIVGFFGLPGFALAQVTDYSAGKSPAQLFSSDCSACHQSARGLAKGRDQRSLAGFLREHYTTKQETATALATFLAGAPAGPAAETRNPGERRQPATPAARVHRPPAAVDQAPADETSIAAPEGGAQPDRRGRTPATREAAKPPAASPAPARGKKPEPKTEPKSDAVEAARAAEEAEKEK
jgi:hypothetical protein